MEDLSRRIALLERRNRILACCLTGVGITLAALVGVAWKSPDGTIEARKIVVTDDDGQVLMVLGKEADGRSGIFLKQGETAVLSLAKDGTGLPQLSCASDKKGQGKVLLGLSAEGDAYVSLRSPGKNRESIGIRARESECILQLCDESGGGSVVAKSAGELATVVVSASASSIVLESLFPRGSQLTACDSSRRTRLTLEVPSRAEPRIELTAEDGSAKWEAGK